MIPRKIRLLPTMRIVNGAKRAGPEPKEKMISLASWKTTWPVRLNSGVFSRWQADLGGTPRPNPRRRQDCCRGIPMGRTEKRAENVMKATHIMAKASTLTALVCACVTLSAGDGSRLAAPVIEHPLSGSSDVGRLDGRHGAIKVVLKWAPVPGVTGYRVQVSRTPYFCAYYERVLGTSVALNLRPATVYWARVARNGSPRVWSAPVRFWTRPLSYPPIGPGLRPVPTYPYIPPGGVH